MAFTQTVVRFENDKGRRVREVVKHSEPEIKHFEIFNKPAITFKAQSDGAKWMIHTDMVIEVFIEEEDPKYGTFKKVRNINY